MADFDDEDIQAAIARSLGQDVPAAAPDDEELARALAMSEREAAGGVSGADDVRAPIAQRTMRLVDKPQRGNMLQQYTPPMLPAKWRSQGGSGHMKKLFGFPRQLMYSGSFVEAVEIAKDSKLWVLVALIDLNPDSPSLLENLRLNRDLWSKRPVEEAIKGRAILWMQDRYAPAGRHLAERYRIGAFPSVIVIDPRTGEVRHRFHKETLFASEEFLRQWEAFLQRDPWTRQAPAGAGLVASPPRRRPRRDADEEALRQAIAASEVEVMLGSGEGSGAARAGGKGQVVDLQADSEDDEVEEQEEDDQGDGLDVEDDDDDGMAAFGGYDAGDFGGGASGLAAEEEEEEEEEAAEVVDDSEPEVVEAASAGGEGGHPARSAAPAETPAASAPTPKPLPDEPPAGDRSVVRVQLRLLGGRRLVRRLRRSEPVSVLFAVAVEEAKKDKPELSATLANHPVARRYWAMQHAFDREGLGVVRCSDPAEPRVAAVAAEALASLPAATQERTPHDEWGVDICKPRPLQSIAPDSDSSVQEAGLNGLALTVVA